ncbi:ATP-binding protein [bacterium]|nr:ATP-binding protein [candidate division CSSED10-310 bacterium]
MTQNQENLLIAVASGKGGTGKTTFATNLAWTLSGDSDRVIYMDCDVEEPNGHLFLNPEWSAAREVKVGIPIVDQDRCIHCGKCGRICRFNAIADLGTRVMTFHDLCHSCGGCMLVCPVQAITEQWNPIGMIRRGHSGALSVIQGELNIGHPTSPPVIREVKAEASGTGIRIIDCPPGTSCPVMESVKGSDFVLLVTESTPFGLFDLRMMVEMLGLLKLKLGVAINRKGLGDRSVYQFCEQRQIPVLMELEDDRKIAEAYSRGELAVVSFPHLKERFRKLMQAVLKRIRT